MSALSNFKTRILVSSPQSLEITNAFDQQMDAHLWFFFKDFNKQIQRNHHSYTVAILSTLFIVRHTSNI